MSDLDVEKKQAGPELKQKQYIDDLSKTKELRLSYTQIFLAKNLPASVKAEAFLVEACKLLEIKPAKSILENVINIQRKLGLPEIPASKRKEAYGFAEYIDGKFGKYTLQNLLKHEKGKELAQYFPAYQKAKRREFAKRENLPPQPTKPSANKPASAPAATKDVIKAPEIKGKAKRIAYIADSNGGKWFLGSYLNTINNRPALKLVKGGEGSRWGRRTVEANLDRFVKEGVTDVVLQLGTNDMSTYGALYYINRPVEKDPTVQNYQRMRELLRKKGIRLRICTIPPLGGYIARKYKQKRERLSGPRAAYWREKYWDKIPRVYKRRYNNNPIAFYKAAEQACYQRWLNVNNWIMAQNNHINFGNAKTVTLSKQKSKDGIHITGLTERKRMAKRIKDTFS